MSLVSEGADLSKPLPSLAEPSLAGVEDYLALLKPRVMSLVVFTALLCIAIGAGASGALNMWYDADIDAVMTRTAKRPIPAGRVTRGEALAFGMTLAVGSYISGIGVLIFLYGVFDAFFIRKEKAAGNPWGPGATTLEWTLSSPPPFHQFSTLPRIK